MKQIADLIRDSDYQLESGALEIYLEQSRLGLLFNEIVSVGYTEDKIVESGKFGYCLSISLDADAWNGHSPFFPTIYEFWSYVKRYSEIPEKFYVLQEHLYSGQDPKSSKIKAIEYYLGWRGLLFSLKDHLGSEANDAALVYFISTEKGAKIYTIDPGKITLDELLEIPEGEVYQDDLEKLRNDISLIDGHQKERRDVLRTSLSEILEDSQKETSIPALIRQGRRLRKKYQENYDLYLHKFSVNKLLSEIEEKSTDYIGKINESISSSQTKAFAIPGAIIAIAALVRNTDSLALFLVCFGLLCIWLLTVIANNIHSEAYASLSDQIKRSLKRYEVMKDEDEVRVSAEQAKEKLLGLIDRSEKRLQFINRLALAVFLLGCFYAVATNDSARNSIMYLIDTTKSHLSPFSRIERFSWDVNDRLIRKESPGSVENVSKKNANEARH